MSLSCEHILEFLNLEWGLEVRPDTRELILKYVQEHMERTGIEDVADYCRFLKLNPAQMHTLIGLVAVNVTCFFRNPLVFEYLADRVIPFMISRREAQEGKTLRVWSAGCATGEEAFSIAILFCEEQVRCNCTLPITIFATDIDTAVLKNRSTQFFSQENVKNVRSGLLEKYFTRNGGYFSLNKEVEDMVSFSKYDLLDTKTFCPPESIFGSFDLILCRNVLIYYNRRYQRFITNKLVQSLNPGRFLVLGEAEEISPGCHGNLETVDSYCHIYKKV